MKPTVVVTGGTSGIGAGVADVLSTAGYHVIAATVSQDEIDQFEGASEIETWYRQFVELSLSFPNPANLPGRNLARDVVPDRENI